MNPQQKQERGQAQKVWVHRQLTEMFLRRAFADEQASKWLVSKDQEPPTSITYEMMKYSITSDMYIVQDNRRPGHIYTTKGSSRDHSTDESEGQGREKKESRGTSSGEKPASSSIPRTRNEVPRINHGVANVLDSQSDMPFTLSQPEKIVFVHHGSVGNRAFFSVTDSRTPFAFLELPSDAVPGVRRGFIQSTSTDMLLTMYHWLENGNSCLMAMLFSYDPKVFTKRCAMLIGPYPSESRNPTIDDVLESACVQELSDCPFCILRGGPCECPPSLLLRLRPPVPMDQRDPWSSWAFFLSRYDSGLKRERFELANFQKSVHVTTEFLFQMDPTLGQSTKRHIDGYRHYLNEVCPMFNGRMLTWSIPTKGNHGQGIEHVAAASGAAKQLMVGPACNQEENTQYFLQDTYQHVFCRVDDIVGEAEAEVEEEYGYEQNMASHDMRASFADQPTLWNDTKNQEIHPAGGSGSHHLGKRTAEQNPGGSVSTPSPDNAVKRRRHTPAVAGVAGTSATPSDEMDENSYDVSAPAPHSDEGARALEFLEEMHQSRVPANTRMPCKLCEIVFIRKSDLRRHVKAVHLPEERRFACSHCESKFKRKEHLDAHVVQVHERNYGIHCEFCGKVLFNESNRRRHIKQSHPEQQQQ